MFQHLQDATTAVVSSLTPKGSSSTRMSQWLPKLISPAPMVEAEEDEEIA